MGEGDSSLFKWRTIKISLSKRWVFSSLNQRYDIIICVYWDLNCFLGSAMWPMGFLLQLISLFSSSIKQNSNTQHSVWLYYCFIQRCWWNNSVSVNRICGCLYFHQRQLALNSIRKHIQHTDGCHLCQDRLAWYVR